MKQQTIQIAGIPALLCGEESPYVYLYVHGRQGCKEEAIAFAELACPAGYQVLAIDLPEHGERKTAPKNCCHGSWCGSCSWCINTRNAAGSRCRCGLPASEPGWPCWRWRTSP